MPREQTPLEEQIEWLSDEVLIIKESLIHLAGRMEVLEHREVTEGEVQIPSPLHKLAAHQTNSPSPTSLVGEPLEDESWAHLGQEVLLPRVAAVSFMMVVALILRTVTDNGMVNLMVGSIIGVVYASGLIGVGFYLYTAKSRLAPVFPACGVLLLYSIIYETHAHFDSLSSQNVYLLLLIAEIVIVLVGLKCRASILLFLAVFGSSVVAIALDFTNPDFALIAAIFFVNIVAGHYAARYGISTKLRWYTLLFSLIVWMLWAYKLNFCLVHTPDRAGVLRLGYFLPILLLFWAFYIYSTLWSILGERLEIGVFHTFLPAIASGGTFFAANAVLKPWIGQQRAVGFVTVMVSACFIALVAWLAKRQDKDALGGKEFVTAATVLLVQGLSVSVPPLLALPVWCGAAGVLTVRSNQWCNGGIRVISYLFQMFVVGYALQGELFRPVASLWWGGAVVATLLCGMTLWLFVWCRTHPPKYESVYFDLFDKGDFSAVILLVLGLFEAFVAARFLASGLLARTLTDPTNALYCAQSIIINIGIVFLLIVGLRLRNKEILVVAGVIVLIAALKVFLFDLLRTTGVPLVLSVFSFGIVAATSSVVMRKWSQPERDKALGKK